VNALPTWVKICGVSALVTFVAAFLPWVSVFGISVAGIHGDGRITATVAVIGAFALLLRAHRLRLTLCIESASGLIVALVGAADLSNFAAFGLYLTLFAGIAWLFGAGLGWRSVRT
jgi:hypothetical protein